MQKDRSVDMLRSILGKHAHQHEHGFTEPAPPQPVPEPPAPKAPVATPETTESLKMRASALQAGGPNDMSARSRVPEPKPLILVFITMCRL